jgi:cytosine/adenosine deaminase-related metal-dependent hydrolase
VVGLEVLIPYGPEHPLSQQRLATAMARWAQLAQRFSPQAPASPQEVQVLAWAPHSIYNVHPQVWHTLYEACPSRWVLMHLAESSQELDWLRQPGDEHGLAYLQKQILGARAFPHARYQPSPEGVFAYWRDQFWRVAPEAQWVLAHACGLNPDTEAVALQALGSSPPGIAHCPQSNWALHHNTLAPAWLPAYAPLGFGTDGRLSTPVLDLRAEYQCSRAHFGLSDEEGLARLTAQAAEALGWQESLGRLQSGAWADMALWSLHTASAQGTASPPLSAAAVLHQVLRPELSACQHLWVAGHLLR